MKRIIIGLSGLCLAMGSIVVYHKQLPPLIAEEHTLAPKLTGGTATPRTFEAYTLLYYTQEDLELMAHTINAEVGTEGELSDQDTNKTQCYCGATAKNRVDCNYNGATTLEEVIFDEGQYACVTDASWDKPITERAYRNAKLILSGAPYWEIYGIKKLPDNVVYQAEFEQGSDIFDKVGDTYYCYK